MKKLHGIIAVYKTKGPSSFAVISDLRKITGEKKIGHAGTLDPLASGILVVGIGQEATKKLDQEVAKEKEYKATFHLGYESTTDDDEGVKTAIDPNFQPNIADIQKALTSFIGEIIQIPPVYSAVKIKGQPAYKLARNGKKVPIRPRIVDVKVIEILSYAWPELRLKITTGPGVYIRSIARDLGKKLKVGAYVSELERKRVGEFTKEKAIFLPEKTMKKLLKQRTEQGINDGHNKTK
ncbi:tRNA pseudouridine(55) synthase TruB [Candidatus Beckwithbacteria bacterium]|nr:tRNA pseudouridine(55) synthase TruB [Candidatus Beckwithbacteria bacterium]